MRLAPSAALDREDSPGVRVVADTNVIVSGFLWGGTPRRLLDTELEDVLLRAKLAERMRRTRFTPAFPLYTAGNADRND
jgi:hypothetical protein